MTVKIQFKDKPLPMSFENISSTGFQERFYWATGTEGTHRVAIDTIQAIFEEEVPKKAEASSKKAEAMSVKTLKLPDNSTKVSTKAGMKFRSSPASKLK